MKREFPKRKNHMILFSKIIDYIGYSGKAKRKGDLRMRIGIKEEWLFGRM